MKAILQYHYKLILRYGKIFPMVFAGIIVMAFLLVPASKKIESNTFRTLTLKFDEAQSSIALKEGKELVSIEKVPSVKKKSAKNIVDYTLQSDKLKEFKTLDVAAFFPITHLNLAHSIFANNFSFSQQPSTYSDGESHSLSTTVSRFILYHTIKAFIA